MVASMAELGNVNARRCNRGRLLTVPLMIFSLINEICKRGPSPGILCGNFANASRDAIETDTFSFEWSDGARKRGPVRPTTHRRESHIKMSQVTR